jgi:hypothetical protein
MTSLEIAADITNVLFLLPSRLFNLLVNICNKYPAVGSDETIDIKKELILKYIAKLSSTKLCIPTEKPLKNITSSIAYFLVFFIECSISTFTPYFLKVV